MPRQILVRDPDGSPTVFTEVLATNEQELHSLIKDHPELIPIEDLELSGPLLVVGKETALPSGAVDLVCLARGGEILVVEFKTGPQNPDFRHVIAQLIDYGSHLWKMSVAEFDRVVIQRFLRKSFESAVEEHWGHDFVEQQLDEARRRMEQQLAGGRFIYVAAAQRFTPVMETSIDYMNATTPSRWYGIEIVRFDADGRVAYESRVVARPPRSNGARPTVADLIDETEFLNRIDDSEYREAMSTLINHLNGIGYRLEYVSAGFSIRVKTQLRPDPISIGWAYPPKAPPGWRGFRDLTLGFEHTYREQFPQSAEVFQLYAERLASLPGAERVLSKNADAYHFRPGDTNEALIDELKAILTDVQSKLSALAPSR